MGAGVAVLLLSACAAGLCVIKRLRKRSSKDGMHPATVDNSDADKQSHGTIHNLSNIAMLKSARGSMHTPPHQYAGDGKQFPAASESTGQSTLGVRSFAAASTESSAAARSAAQSSMPPTLLITKRVAPPGEGAPVTQGNFSLNLPSTIAEPNASEQLITALLNMATPPVKEFAGKYVLSDDFVQGGQVWQLFACVLPCCWFRSVHDEGTVPSAPA